MSSLLQNYESECQVAINQAKVLLSNASSDAGVLQSGGSSEILSQIEQYYEESLDLIDQMEIELNNTGSSLDSKARASYKAKIRDYRKQCQNDIKTPLKKLIADNDRAQLLQGHTFENDEQRQQLLSNHAILQRTGDKLTDGTRLASETENVGAQIMMDLRSQRETLENARQTLFHADSYVDKSISTLKTMSRRLIANKFISYAIIAVLILLILLVKTLKKMGEVVAVTGDGTNDAPALKLADVGFSMGIAGTEVAREASDIILMTDDFSAIVNAIKWGRCVAVSIKKFIQFQLTVNITAVILTFVSAVASSEEASVLTAVQLLWVNLIMDTLAALALATDKPDEFILDRKPKGRDAPLIAVSTWKMILGQATLQLTVTFVLHFRGKHIFFPHHDKITGHQQEQLDAMTFNTFVWLQFFKLIVTRKLDEADGIKSFRERLTANNLNFYQHLFRNYYFLAIAVLIGAFQILIMFVGGAAFSIARQTPAMWATAIICGLLSLPAGAFIRACPDEWALAIYPRRIVRPILYVIGLEFIFNRNKNKKRDDHEEDEEASLLVDHSDEQGLVETSAFRRAKSEMLTHKEHPHGSESSKFNPFSVIKRWRNSTEEDNESDDDHSLIASVTMVPTLVGGAIGGFSHITDARKSDSTKEEKTTD